MHLLCPHCHSPIELVDLASKTEILCPSCGSNFRLDQESTIQAPSGEGARRLGKFELREKLGVGAFGTVYKAWDTELERVVAVKVPRAGNVNGEQELDRFLREARSVAQLRHPGIVPVYEVGRADGLPFLVSDFVKGVTLADALSGRRFSFAESAQLIAGLAESLQVAHTEGIVHRDVKPSNIMLADNGAPQLMDFGLAKRDAGEITMTLEGQVLGTPAYMSPEQARGEAHQVDGRGDVYSLGVILYRLLTGELPFRGNTRMLLHQVLHDEPQAPHKLNDKIPRDLDTICLKAMAKEALHRYQTAGQLAEDLRHFLKGEPISARPIGRIERSWRWARRNPAVASLTTIAALLFLATFTAISIGYWNDSRAKKAFKEQRDLALQREEDALRLSKSEEAAKKDALARERESRENLRAALIYQAQALRQSYQPGRRALSLEALKRAAAIRPDPELRTEFIRCLDLADLRAVPGAKEQILTFRGAGDRIVTRTKNGGLAELEFPSRNLLTERTAAQTPDKPIAWSADGRFCVSVDPKTEQAQVWDLDSPTPPVHVKDANGKPVVPRCLAFSNGADLLALAARLDATRFRLFVYDVKEQKIRQTWETQAREMDALGLGPDGKLCAAIVTIRGASGTPLTHALRLWQVGEAKTLAELPSTEPVEKFFIQGGIASPDLIDFSRDGRLLAVAWESGTVTVYSLTPVYRFAQIINAPIINPEPVPGPKEIVSIPTRHGLGEPGGTLAVRFSPDGRWLVSLGMEDSLKLWETRSGSLIVQSPPAGFTFDRDDFKTAQTGSLRWPEPKPRFAASFEFKTAQTGSLRWTTNGAILLGNLDQDSSLWELERPVARSYDAFNLELNWVECLAFSPDEHWLARSSLDVALVDLHSPELEPVSLQPNKFVTDLAFAPDADRLWAHSRGEGASLWQLPNPLARSPQPTNKSRTLVSVGFTPDGQRLGCGAENKQGPKVWNLDTGRVLLNLAEKIPASTDWSIRGGYLLYYRIDGAEGLLRVLNLTDASTLCSIKLAGIPRFCAFAEEGRLLAVTDSKEIIVFDPQTGKQIATLKGHDGMVTGLSFDGTARLLASVSLSDGTARLWNTATGEQLAVFPSGVQLPSKVALSRSGRWLALGATGPQVRLWDLAQVRQRLKEAGLDWSAPPLPMAPTPAPGSAEAFLAEAQHKHLTQHYLEAVEAYTKSLAMDSKQPTLYRDRGEANFKLQRYNEAVADFEMARELAPELPYGEHFVEALQSRALRSAELGQWRQAETDLLKAIKNGLEKALPTRDRALVRLAAGDVTAYRRLCDSLLLGLTGKEKPATTNPIIWTCVLSPNTLQEYRRLQELAEDGADSAPRDWLYQNTLGAVLCRAGQHDAAIERLNHSIEVSGKEGHPRDWLFLAIGYSHLGHAADARKWLDKANRWLEANSMAKSPNAATAKLTFNERLELLLLRREAQDLLKGSKPEPNK